MATLLMHKRQVIGKNSDVVGTDESPKDRNEILAILNILYITVSSVFTKRTQE